MKVLSPIIAYLLENAHLSVNLTSGCLASLTPPILLDSDGDILNELCYEDLAENKPLKNINITKNLQIFCQEVHAHQSHKEAMQS